MRDWLWRLSPLILGRQDVRDFWLVERLHQLLNLLGTHRDAEQRREFEYSAARDRT